MTHLSRPFPFALLVPWLLVGLISSSCVTERRLDPRIPARAQAASQEQNWREAQELWAKVLSHSGGQDREARLRLVEALLASDQSGSALRTLQKVEPTPPATDTEHWKWVGRAQLAQGQVREAGQAFAKVLTHEPDDRETLVRYGEALLEGERGRRGVELLLRALRIEVGDGELAERTARRANELGMWSQSFEANRLRLQAPAPPWHAYLGAANSADLDRETKGEWLFEAVRLNPQTSVGWRLIGDWHAEQEENGLALRAWRKSVEADPMDLQACRKLAEWYVNAGDCVSARPWIEHGLPLTTNEHERETFERLQTACAD